MFRTALLQVSGCLCVCLSASVCLCVCVCLSISVCSSVCRSAYALFLLFLAFVIVTGKRRPQTRRSFEFCTISFTRFVVFSFRLLFFSFVVVVVFACHTLPSIVLRSPTQSTPAALLCKAAKLTHKEEQPHHHRHHTRESERATGK